MCKNVNKGSLINFDEGASINNLLKEIRYSTYYQNNPFEILENSKAMNVADDEPLGGQIFTSKTATYDSPTVEGHLPDIHPCKDTETPIESEPNLNSEVVENLDSEVVENNKNSNLVIRIILYIVMLIIALALSYITYKKY